MIEAEKNNLLGVLINGIDRESAADLIIQAAHQRRTYAVSALAVHGVMEGVLDSVQLYRLNHLEMVVADGQPVRWALNVIHSVGLRQRVYGPNLTSSVLVRAARERIPVYFYGSTETILQLLCVNLRGRFPELIIAGVQPSAFGRIDPEAANQIADRIKQSGAQIVFVGLGCPRQEVWAYEFRDRLQMPIIAVGAAFPFLAGTLRQAPEWMQDRGLEWLFRLSIEPRRLWKRYLLLSPMYLFLVACQRLGLRFGSLGKAPDTEVLFG
ncbi:MAG TPA: WecB/TagA/CpsF family glycosyltransferase [Candidatus Sulfotelmatobacter sp.]|nr:WecB/TagA/CpsF family glycosyltransferase [Candidatus Sulfotelmatobacter sp.]